MNQDKVLVEQMQNLSSAYKAPAILSKVSKDDEVNIKVERKVMISEPEVNTKVMSFMMLCYLCLTINRCIQIRVK